MGKLRYELLRLTQERNYYPDPVTDLELDKLKLGLEGEAEVERIFKETDPSWLVIPDYTFDLNGPISQVDLIVIIGNTWLVIEVKNYAVDFTYKNRRGWFADASKPMNGDIMSAFERRIKLLKDLTYQSGLRVDVEGLMVFVNPASRINIDPESVSMFNFQILDIHGLNLWINQNKGRINTSWKKLARTLRLPDDKAGVRNAWENELSSIESALGEYECEDYRYFPDPITDYDYALLKKGVACSECRYIKMDTRQRHFHCPECGHLEAKKDGVIRTAIELRTIFYNDDHAITTSRLCDFIENAVHRRNVVEMLSETFTKNNLGKYTSYNVPTLRGPNVKESIEDYKKIL